MITTQNALLKIRNLRSVAPTPVEKFQKYQFIDRIVVVAVEKKGVRCVMGFDAAPNITSRYVIAKELRIDFRDICGGGVIHSIYNSGDYVMKFVGNLSSCGDLPVWALEQLKNFFHRLELKFNC